MKINIDSSSPEQTKRIASKISQHLKGGEVIELISDLGGGKTTFVHGLALGIGSDDNVSSPTFTINSLYEGSKLKLYHFDFYRLSEPGILIHELDEVIGDKTAVVVIEWPAIVQANLPMERLSIKFEVVDVNKRKIQINYPESMSYLIN